MLTRRIGLEPVVPQHPAPTRALLRPSRARRRMKKARARCPQLGNNLWTKVHPPGSKGPCSVYRAGSPRILEEPQHRRHLGCSRLSSPSRGGAGSGPSGGTACASRTGGRGGLVKGRASTRKRWLLQPAHPRARDRRCLSNTDRDTGQSSTRPSQVVVMPGRLCGESRSGPETWKLGQRGDRKDGHAAGDNARRGKHRAGHTTSSRFKVIRGCARRSNWSQTRRSGPGKRAAFDGAASGSGPGTFSLGGESNPVNPSAGSATEGVRGRVTTLAPGRQSLEKGALLGGLEITGPQGQAG
jgi:hypothetical protein